MKFFHRLRARGYLPSQLLPLFHRGFRLAELKPMHTTRNKRIKARQQQLLTIRRNTPNETVILHIPYHPKDPPSREIQQRFRNNFLACNSDVAGFKQLIIAYSRPRNLGEILSYHRIDTFNCPPDKEESILSHF